MPLVHVELMCKEVVIPDKKGKPIGGLTCKYLEKPGNGYTPWNLKKKPSGQLDSYSEPELHFMDTDTGEILSLGLSEATVICLALRKAVGS